ncbi:MAG TPA: arginase family protein [Nitrososphaerales archaeon]|nr:arginase family protein [Nitrososphaerales archaeon]
MGPWTLLGAPIYTLSSYKGMGEAPAALRKAGIGTVLGLLNDRGDVEIPHLKKDVQEGKTKNLAHFREASSRIFRATSEEKEAPVMIIGGECSETVGAMAGLARAYGGKPGMLWLDAHGDFNVPETSPSGYIGGMCLAMACGMAVGLDLGIGPTPPPLAGERLVHVGSRALDTPEVVAFNSSPAKLFTTQQVKKIGAADVAEEAARHLDNRSDWIACHLDVDVVDPDLIPSVNYPTPGGLTLEETSMVIRRLIRTGKVRVLELAAYNPSMDRRAASAKRIIELLRASFE